MTLTLTTTLTIPHLGPTALTVEVDFSYSHRAQELIIEGAATRIDGREFPVWHLLTQTQRAVVEEQCMDHWRDLQQEKVEIKAEERKGG